MFNEIYDKVLTCPYCGREQFRHKPDEISVMRARATCEYRRCGKEFFYSVEIKREYESMKCKEVEHDHSSRKREAERAGAERA